MIINKLRIFLGLALLMTFNSAFSQKKHLNNDSYKTWEQLNDDYQISNNGNYIYYTVHHSAGHSKSYLYNTKTKSVLAFPEINGEFRSDGKEFIFQKADSLGILNLKTGITNWTSGINSFSLVGAGALQYALIRTPDGLNIQNVNSRKFKHFEGVLDYKANKQGTMIVIKTVESLSIISLQNLQSKVLFKGKDIPTWIFDGSGKRLAFVSKKDSLFDAYTYEVGDEKPKVFLSSDTFYPDGLSFKGELQEFSPDGNLLYFKLKSKSKTDEYFEATDKKPRLWSFTDLFVKSSARYGEWKFRDNFIAAKKLVDGAKIVLIENDSLNLNGVCGNKFVILHSTNRNRIENYSYPEWNEYCELVDVTSGKVVKGGFDFSAKVSPCEKYVTCSNYFNTTIYDISTGKSIYLNGSIEGWQSNEKACLVSQSTGLRQRITSTDFSLIEPKTGRVVLDLTSGFGKKNKILFKSVLFNPNTSLLPNNGELLLSGFNTESKKDGLYLINLCRISVPRKLISTPQFINPEPSYAIPYPVKQSADGNAYLFVLQSASESANLYFTRDFKSITKVSDIHPEKDYNWMTSELINYPKKDSTEGQAILYKPENFDPTKKYPVIFYYYQKYTDALNAYLNPDLSIGQLSIPWYVSNGYIVCIPDIINIDGKKHVETVLNSVEGAAIFLKQYNWIDGAHMGIQGHSFGGYETGLLATNSHAFAAAQPSAGIYDLISARGQLGFGNNELNSSIETGQVNLNVSLWEDTQSYLKNSSLLKADNVTTPILLMHGNFDGSVDFRQAVEFFTALRRLKKPCWLLEYKTGHTLREAGEEAELDFTIKQQQFFGHYLKGEPMPDWMK